MRTEQRPEGGLLQSRGWAVFQRATGAQVIAITQKEYPIFGIVRTVPIVGRYLYVPRGKEGIIAHKKEIISAAKRQGCRWVRIEPEEECVDNEAIAAPHDMQPRCVLQMNIIDDEGIILARMKGKTRYNIRRAEKKGVQISTYRHGDDGAYEALEDFIGLVRVTARRKGVHFHQDDYYRKMFEHVKHDSGTDIILYVARYNGTVIAANIITICGRTATYLHGATSDEHRSVMAPFLLQWQAIVDAKKRSCQWYDFGGIFFGDVDQGKKGITRFKQGFAPEEPPLCMPGSYDIPVDVIGYRVYRAMTALKKIIARIKKL